MDIMLSDFKAGVWKFTNALFKIKDYLDLINKVIQEEKCKYALPVYSFDYLEKATDNITFFDDDE